MRDNYANSEVFTHINHFHFLNYILPWADHRSREADPALHGLAVSILQTLMNKPKEFLVQRVDMEQVERGLIVIINQREVLVVPNQSPEIPDPRGVTRLVKLVQKRHPNKKLILTFLSSPPSEGRFTHLKAQLVHLLKLYRNTTPDHQQHQIVNEYHDHLSHRLAEMVRQSVFSRT